MLGPLDKKFSGGGGGGIAIIATSSRVQVETLRVDLELYLEPKLVNIRGNAMFVKNQISS